MKLQHLFEEESQYALLLKTVKLLHMDTLKKFTKQMSAEAVSVTVNAIKAGVSSGYWGYVTQAANAAKTGGDLHVLTWALGRMKDVNQSEMPYFVNLHAQVLTVDTEMENARKLLKGMDATKQVLDVMLLAANGGYDNEAFTRSTARAVLKKLGVAEQMGISE